MQRDFIYGIHSAEEALRKDPGRVNQIWLAKEVRNPRVKELIHETRRHRIPVKMVDAQALHRLAGTRNHQGILLEITPYRYVDADELLENITDQSLFCILDEIQDATNLGTLIRTMEGAGVGGAFLPERRTASVTAVTHRLSAGALEHVRIARVGNLAQLIDRMKSLGVRIICADVSAPKLWYEADYEGPVAILVGNEQKGVRRLLKEKSDERVRIPMRGKIRSLNVNVAAALLLYEAVRRRS